VLLGEEHDLTVPRYVLGSTPDDVIDRPTRDRLIAQIDRRREQRRNRAKALGAQLFREPARPFAHRLKSGFESARRSA
jgi:hypothetical protein